MNPSAMRRLAFVVALGLLTAACSGPPEPGDLSAKSQAAWELYRSHPDPSTYENFIVANRNAASVRSNPHDRPGIEYQLRALEVMSDEAVRTHDVAVADDVVERIADIERHGLVNAYEETLPGAKDRLAAAKAKAGALIR
jgi:hypothetical protein